MLNILNILLFDFCHDVVFKTILEKKVVFPLKDWIKL